MNSNSMADRLRRSAVIVVAITAALTATFGLLYNSMSAMSYASRAFGSMPNAENLPYFDAAFVAMSAVCVGCYVTMITSSIGLFRRRRWAGPLLVFVLLFEVAYFYTVGSLWLNPAVGLSVAAATGIANGGLTLPFVIFLPLWAPLVLLCSGSLWQWECNTRAPQELLSISSLSE